MASVSEARYCARGERCARYDPQTGKPEKLSRYNKNDICARCQEEHAGGIWTPGKADWMGKVVEAIEAVYTERCMPCPAGGLSLWDLFRLSQEDHEGRDAALARLAARTLRQLRDWLEEQKQEAVERYDERQYKFLHNAVSFMAALNSLPPDMPLFPERKDTDSPFDAVAYYTRRGSSRDLALPILVAARAEELRQERRHVTEREIERIIEEELGVSRTTQKRWSDRMKELGMTWRRFTTDQLKYVRLGGKRGPRKSEPEGSSEE